jgi:NADP-dependent 3-hydroxy acid dehydrogenase YdfG
LVTGASAGIGHATALALAREGANLILTGRRAPELHALSEACQALGVHSQALAGDLQDEDFVQTLAAAASEADIFINNAGVLTYAPLVELTPAQVQAMFNVNVLASIRISQLVGAEMAARGRGHIVVMTSLSARNINRLSAVYGATKHAMSGIAKGLRIELKGQGIKVTEIAPGMVDTAIRDGNDHPEAIAAVTSRTYAPLTPEDVADAVVYAVGTPENCCPDLIELRPTRA